MPFMTEELWSLTAPGEKPRDGLICHAQWPELEFEDEAAADEINWLIDLVSGIRSARSEMNVPPSAKAPLVVVGANTLTEGRLERHEAAVQRLARVEAVSFEHTAPKGAAQVIVREATACLPLGSLIDLAAETARLQKALGKVDADIAKIAGKLANEKFVANAKPEVVEAEREKITDLESQKASLETALKRIAEAG
jgi:valyl-tRNA synthetase